jgi:hypothetical protein
MIKGIMTQTLSQSPELATQSRHLNRIQAHKYLSAGEALALASIFTKAREQLALTHKLRFKLFKSLSKFKQFWQWADQVRRLESSEERKCPNFDDLLSATNNISSDEYDRAQKQFGIDFHPNYLSKNYKLDLEIQSFHKLSDFIATADIATINPQWAAQRERANTTALRHNLIDFKTKLYAIDDNYSFQISAACIINNEARFLKEWLDFHRLVGIEHFFLFNNRSEDNYLEVLEPYIKQGIVDLISWNTGDTAGDDWIYIEAEALSCALRLAHGRSKWLAMIDTDEYLFPAQSESLTDALKEFEPYGSVSVRYTVFGTSDVQRIPSDKLLIETLTKSCLDSSSHNNLFKSIVRPEYVDSCINSHYCQLMPGFINVTEDLTPMNPENIAKVQNKKLALNHYWTRDLDYFRAHKLPRLSNWGIAEDQCMRNIAELNAVERTDILRFVHKLKNFAKTPDKVN